MSSCVSAGSSLSSPTLLMSSCWMASLRWLRGEGFCVLFGNIMTGERSISLVQPWSWLSNTPNYKTGIWLNAWPRAQESRPARACENVGPEQRNQQQKKGNLGWKNLGMMRKKLTKFGIIRPQNGTCSVFSYGSFVNSCLLPFLLIKPHAPLRPHASL